MACNANSLDNVECQGTYLTQECLAEETNKELQKYDCEVPDQVASEGRLALRLVSRADYSFR